MSTPNFCIVCRGPRDGLASWKHLGIDLEVPVCNRCRSNGALKTWLAEQIGIAMEAEENEARHAGEHEI